MKRLTITLLSIIAMTATAFATSSTLWDNDRPIKYEELPAEAKTFIAKNFSNETTACVIEDKEVIGSEYKVVFESGTKLEFDNKGKWTDIDCRNSEVPNNLVPKKIAEYVKKNYDDKKITELKRDRMGWDVELSGGLDLEFNNNYQLVEIDD